MDQVSSEVTAMRPAKPHSQPGRPQGTQTGPGGGRAADTAYEGLQWSLQNDEVSEMQGKTYTAFKLNNHEPGMVAHACPPNPWEADAGGFL